MGIFRVTTRVHKGGRLWALAILCATLAWAASAGDSKARLPPVGPPTPSSGSVLSSERQVLDVAAQAVATAQGHVAAVQTVGGILAAFLAVIGVFFGIAGLLTLQIARRYGDEVKTLESDLQHLSSAKAILESTLSDLSTSKEQIEASISELRERKVEVAAVLSGLQHRAEAMRAVIELESAKGDKLRILQRLSQYVDPIAIGPLTKVLEDSTQEVRLRKEAAYGLGRFARTADSSEFSAPIVACFRSVLTQNGLPKAIMGAALEGLAKYGCHEQDCGASA